MMVAPGFRVPSASAAAIMAAASAGLIGGYEDGTFLPDRTITRAQVVTIINRAKGISKKAENQTYKLDKDAESMSKKELEAVIKKMTKDMHIAAADLNSEKSISVFRAIVSRLCSIVLNDEIVVSTFFLIVFKFSAISFALIPTLSKFSGLVFNMVSIVCKDVLIVCFAVIMSLIAAESSNNEVLTF